MFLRIKIARTSYRSGSIIILVWCGTSMRSNCCSIRSSVALYSNNFLVLDATSAGFSLSQVYLLSFKEKTVSEQPAKR